MTKIFYVRYIIITIFDLKIDHFLKKLLKRNERTKAELNKRIICLEKTQGQNKVK